MIYQLQGFIGKSDAWNRSVCWQLILPTTIIDRHCCEVRLSPQLLPIYSNRIPLLLHTQQTQSAHPITAQYMVLCDGLTEGHFFQLCCGFGYQRCCITVGWSSDWLLYIGKRAGQIYHLSQLTAGRVWNVVTNRAWQFKLVYHDHNS